MATWYYTLPEPELVPLPRAFLTPTSLVVELRQTEGKQSDLVLSPRRRHPHSTARNPPWFAGGRRNQVFPVTGRGLR